METKYIIHFICILLICIFIIIIIYKNNIYEKLIKQDIELFPIKKKQDIELSPILSKNDIEDLKKGQKIMTNTLRIFDKICRKHGFTYWVFYGTFIGVIRHGGWIPWDGDIDVVMLEDDYKKFEKIIRSELPNYLVYEDVNIQSNNNLYICKIRHKIAHYKRDTDISQYSNDIEMGIMLDIMLARKNNNGDLQIVNFDNFIFTHYELFPLKEKLFEDVLVYIPNKYDVISKRKYGSFPPEIIPIKDRYPHEGRINPNIPSEKMRKLYNL